MDIQQKARSAARYICCCHHRVDLCDDVEQDLLVMMLSRNITNPSIAILKKRATDYVLSKRYNGKGKKLERLRYTFIEIDSIDLESLDAESDDLAALSVEDESSDVDDRIYIEGLLGVLPLISRDYIELWMMDYTHDEIGKKCNKSRSSVTKTINSTLELLRESTDDNRQNTV